MSDNPLPSNYTSICQRFPKITEAMDAVGQAVHEEGPIDRKTAHLIQLAAAVSIHSQGSAKSHVRRALEAGATADEIHHSILLLTSTIGFPTMSAALSWVDDELNS